MQVSSPAKRQTATTRPYDRMPSGTHRTLRARHKTIKGRRRGATERLASLRRRHALETYDGSADLNPIGTLYERSHIPLHK